MPRFHIDMPRLHDQWAAMRDDDLLPSFSYTGEADGQNLATMFRWLLDGEPPDLNTGYSCVPPAIVGPPDRRVVVLGFDECTEMACITIYLCSTDGEPALGEPTIYDLDHYFDADDLDVDNTITPHVLEVVANLFVDQLNELDRWRVIAR